MCPDRRIGRQRGSMLVIALAVMVILGLLTVALTRLLGNASDSLAYEVLSVRAQSLAQSGMDQRLYVVLRQGVCASGLADSASGSQTVDETGLSGCTLSWSCRHQSLTDEDGSPLEYYWLQTQGQCGNAQLQVTRQSSSEVRL